MSEQPRLPVVRNHKAATRSRSARRPQDWLVRQLPSQMVDSKQHAFFVKFVRGFQDQGDVLLEHADNVENLVDLTVTPATHIDWLGSWIGLAGLDPDVPEAFRRRFTAGAARTLSMRGTVRGLQDYLELLTDEPAVVEDDGGVRYLPDPEVNTTGPHGIDPPRVVMRVADTGAIFRGDAGSGPADDRAPVRGGAHAALPVTQTQGQLSLDEFISLVRAEIPAHVEAELILGGDRVWSSEEDEDW